MKPPLREAIRSEIKSFYDAEPLAKKIEFEAKVKEATDTLKAFVTSEVQRVEKKKTLFWKLVALTFFLINIVLLFASPWEIGRIVAEQVQENVIVPGVRNELDKIVRDNSSAYVDKQLGPFKKTVDDLHNQILPLKDTIAEAEQVSKKAESVTTDLQQQSTLVSSQLNSINTTLQATVLIVRADHDDRQAFDSLYQLAKTPSPLSGIATEVILALVSDNKLNLTYSPDWKALNVSNADQLSLSDLKNLYSSQMRSDFKEGLLQYIWDNNKFSKHDRLELLMSVIRGDRSINAVRYALNLVNNEAKINHNLLDCQAYYDWWAKNQDSYKTLAPAAK